MNNKVRRSKIASRFDNSSSVTNRDLIYMISDPDERRRFGLTTELVEFIEKLERHIDETMSRLQRAATKRLGAPVIDVSVVLNFRDSCSGRSNAGDRPGRWRSQHETRLRSSGDTINLNSVWGRMHEGFFHEYSHIAKDPQIGDIETGSWKEYIEILLAHEFAHVLERYVTAEGDFPIYEATQCKGHGKNWQLIYRQLRIALGRVKVKSNKPATVNRAMLAAAPQCEHCGAPVLKARRDARFCSVSCRVAANRKAKRESA